MASITIEDGRVGLYHIRMALASYPAPVRVRQARSQMYIDPLTFASYVYAQLNQEDALEAEIAFADMYHLVLAQGDEYRQRSLFAMIDDEPYPEQRADRHNLLRDLSVLTMVFIGPLGDAFAGAYSEPYFAVCRLAREIATIPV